ncbi:MAG: serine/threonine-protein kinase [Myxococcota bacterium]
MSVVGAVLAGTYRVDAMLGRGGMGAVYRGHDVAEGRPVAIKVLLEAHDAGSAAWRRFEREARALGRLGHPNIVQVFGTGALEDGRPFLVMELLEGETLFARIQRQHALPVAEACEIMARVLSALAAAHAQEVVHRDLKPDNVFLSRTGQVKLLDFGVAKHLGADDSATLTRAGAVVGTPYYLSPEQARGEASSDPRVDLWAAGVVLYETLTGELPFRAHNFAALLATILRGHPLPPTRLRPEIGRDLERVVLRALAERAEDRWDSAAALRTALLEAAAALPAPAE